MLKKQAGTARRPFTVAELQTILAAADDEWRSMIFFGLYTGQRLGDLARLNWQNVDLVSGEISITTAKTGRLVRIPIVSPLLTHLEKLPAGDDPKAPLHPRAAKLATGVASLSGATTVTGLSVPPTSRKRRSAMSSVRW